MFRFQMQTTRDASGHPRRHKAKSACVRKIGFRPSHNHFRST
jgi:hypothetical protein